jgi:hypothetical protein
MFILEPEHVIANTIFGGIDGSAIDGPERRTADPGLCATLAKLVVADLEKRGWTIKPKSPA